jgi:hypothetical protein
MKSEIRRSKPEAESVATNSFFGFRSSLGFRISAFGFALFLLLAQPSPLPAQPASPNRVLELDGTNSFVQLPANIFDSLTQATVEG